MSFSTKEKFGQFVLSRRFSSGMSTGLMTKDLRSAMAVFEIGGASSELLATSLSSWTKVEERLGSYSDHTEAYRFVEERKKERPYN
jgi:3-hydroxyisobutyrate dehydrogenase-like beta-hydroxyacid dehydrogenase